jgi:hypothetical protein
MPEKATLRSETTKMATINDVIQELRGFKLELKADVDALSKSQNEKFVAVNTLLEEIQSNQESLMQRNTEMRVDLDQLTTAHGSLEKDYLESKKKIEVLTTTVDSLNHEVNALQQMNLSHNMIINGLPTAASVDKQHIISIAKLLDFNVEQQDVLEVRRVKTKKAGFVKVTFSTKNLRDLFLKKRKGKSIYSDEINIKLESRHQIFMQEDLTFANQTLLFHARKLKNYGYSTSWSTNGRVLVKHLATEQILAIKSQEHVAEIIGGGSGNTT